MNLRYPELNAPDADGKLRQLQSYLFQLVDILNIGLSQQETAAQEVKQAAAELAKTTPKTPRESFDAIKGLIIKSADIVNSYSETISKNLRGEYVAVSDFGTYTKSALVQMELSPDSLQSTMERVETISNQQKSDYELLQQEISRVEQKADNVEIRVGSVESNGVTRVTTETGFTFDKDGLKISQSGKPITNLLNNEGMYVRYGDTDMLRANKDGVLAKDVSVKNYLIIGDNARFEDYSDGSDTKRTACFWIGGT